MNDKVKPPEWIGSEFTWRNASEAVRTALANYSLGVLNLNEDTTMKDAKREFWNRLGEHYGFNIHFNDEEKKEYPKEDCPRCKTPLSLSSGNDHCRGCGWEIPGATEEWKEKKL